MSAAEKHLHRKAQSFVSFPAVPLLLVVTVLLVPLVSGTRHQLPSGRGRGVGSGAAAAVDVRLSGTSSTTAAAAAGRAVSTFSETSPRCVLIPLNLTVCRRFGYTQMRLPNLLNHTTVDELLGTDSRPSWSRLALRVPAAAAELPLFLCSLLTPVCLDRPIRPCASLCRRARTASERVLLDAGLAWPEEFECGLFPSDDELCIGTSTRPTAAAEVDGRLNNDDADNAEVIAETSSPSSRHHVGQQRVTTPPLSAVSGRSILSRRLFDTSPQRREQRKQHKESFKSTGAAKCSVCDQFHSVGDELLNVLCEADFVAKIRPDRYIRAGSNLKIVAGRATRFYKLNQPSTMSPGGTSSGSVNYNHRRVSFFIPDGAKCDCLVTDDTQTPESPSLLVVGKIERRRQDRLVITGAIPFQSSRLAVRRILREVRDPRTCDIAADDPHTSDNEEMPRRRLKPKRKLLKAKKLEQQRSGKKNGGGIGGDNDGVDDGVGKRGRKMKVNGKRGARKNLYQQTMDAAAVGGNRGLKQKQKVAEQQRKRKLKERRRSETDE